ncbi:hypothetical protein [Enteroscipio rubneri]|uniref:Uncharacterized protein n=1 Tax=Enteroscipio rubneri TaxID=2070686 RepID=A0A2K2UA02_9ACTN|nr:hypothetical protein [Enteroscipio rubneri]PNV67147.1 hypothetical protein C2L71_09435 [Enteroscipio rubneri]
MKYSGLLDGGVTEDQLHEYFAGGKPDAITLRVPENPKDAAAETTQLRGVIFSAFIRACDNELSKTR